MAHSSKGFLQCEAVLLMCVTQDFLFDKRVGFSPNTKNPKEKRKVKSKYSVKIHIICLEKTTCFVDHNLNDTVTCGLWWQMLFLHILTRLFWGSIFINHLTFSSCVVPLSQNSSEPNTRCWPLCTSCPAVMMMASLPRTSVRWEHSVPQPRGWAFMSSG